MRGVDHPGASVDGVPSTVPSPPMRVPSSKDVSDAGSVMVDQCIRWWDQAAPYRWRAASPLVPIASPTLRQDILWVRATRMASASSFSARSRRQAASFTAMTGGRFRRIARCRLWFSSVGKLIGVGDVQRVASLFTSVIGSRMKRWSRESGGEAWHRLVLRAGVHFESKWFFVRFHPSLPQVTLSMDARFHCGFPFPRCVSSNTTWMSVPSAGVSHYPREAAEPLHELSTKPAMKEYDNREHRPPDRPLQPSER